MRSFEHATAEFASRNTVAERLKTACEDSEPLFDLGAKLSKRTPLYLYHGSKDETARSGTFTSTRKVSRTAVVRPRSGRDHQLNNDVSEIAADIRRLKALRT